MELKKKIFSWKNHRILFQLHVSAFFFNIRLYFVQFILCHVCLFRSLIYDYWWLHVHKYFGMKQFRRIIRVRQITYAAEAELRNLEKLPGINENHGILFSVFSGKPEHSSYLFNLTKIISKSLFPNNHDNCT